MNLDRYPHLSRRVKEGDTIVLSLATYGSVCATLRPQHGPPVREYEQQVTRALDLLETRAVSTAPEPHP